MAVFRVVPLSEAACRDRASAAAHQRDRAGKAADTALRRAKHFGVSESLWMGLQADYGLEQARKDPGKRLDRTERRAA